MNSIRQSLLGSEFIVTAEVAESTDGENLDSAAAIAHHVDAVQVGTPSLEAGLSPVAMAVLLRRRGIDPLPVIRVDDMNRIALTSDLMGLRALGVSAFVLHGGVSEPETAPYAVSTLEAVSLASELNDEEWANSDHEFLAGSAVDLVTEDGTDRAEALSSAGVRFLQVEPVADLSLLREAMQRLVDQRTTWRSSIIVTLDLADGADACAGRMAEVAEIPGVSGVHLRVAGDVQAVPEVIARSGVR